MSFQFYSALHLSSLLCLFFSLGGLTLQVMESGVKSARYHRLLLTIHGLGLTLALVAGFGMLARLGQSVSAPWVLMKLGIWLILGLIATPVARSKRFAHWAFYLIMTLGMAGAIVANTKPGATLAQDAEASK